jgi:hypothetical protein
VSEPMLAARVEALGKAIEEVVDLLERVPPMLSDLTVPAEAKAAIERARAHLAKL